MSNACVLKLLEIVQHGLAKRLAIAKFGLLVFQVNRFRFVELIIRINKRGPIWF